MQRVVVDVVQKTQAELHLKIAFCKWPLYCGSMSRIDGMEACDTCGYCKN